MLLAFHSQAWESVAGILALLTIIGILVKVASNGFRLLHKMHDAQEWVLRQMQANGAAAVIEQPDTTVRGLLDLTVERTANLAAFAVDNNHRLERIEGNQREQGGRLTRVIAEHEKALAEHSVFVAADVRHDEALAELTRTVGLLSADVEALRVMFEAHMEGHR